MRNFEFPGRSPAYAAHGMAATSSPLATLAALDVLRAGGNAADAAVTASVVLCVTEPHMTGIGGDCFALIGKPNGKISGINGSGRAGMAADGDWLKASGLKEISRENVHSVTVPGAIDAWEQILKVHGTMDLGQALQPAIRYAQEGVAVTPRVARDWVDHESALRADEGGHHFLINGRAPKVGEIVCFPAFAKTLSVLAKEGREAFYTGSIAAEMVAHLRKRGGLLTLDDLARTKSTWVEPVSTSFAEHAIHEIPPNGQGLTVLIALNVLSQRGLRQYAPGSVQHYHLMIEAMKMAWVFRNRHICDPGDAGEHEIPVSELLGDALAMRLAGLIDMRRVLDVEVALPRSDTVYLTVVDQKRLAVSFINSVYEGFGSGIVLPKGGFALQNRGSCFVTTPGHPNCIGPGKRPLHTIIPAMASRGNKIDMAFGVMGGDFQPMGHLMVAVNRYVHGMDPQEAIDMARVMPSGKDVLFEAALPADIQQGLAALGHAMIPANEPLGGGQAIAIDHATGTLVGGSDGRKDGLALGY